MIAPAAKLNEPALRLAVHLDLPAALRAQIARFLDQQQAPIEFDPRWLDTLRDGLGHRPCVLTAHDAQGELCGLLPLALVASSLFGRFLVSLPYLNRAGVLAPEPAVADQLVQRAVQQAQQLRVSYLELRHEQPVDHELLPQQRDEKQCLLLELPGDGEALWAQLNAKVRNQVRKGDKSELTLQWGGGELLEAFYAVFSVNMRDLGTPVYGRAFFAALLEHFAGEAELAVVSHAGQPIAGALLVHDDRLRRTQVPSASCLRAFNHTNANMWMYHQLLLRALARGSKTFDFGRSSVDSGTYRFKRQWGAMGSPTVWQYHVLRGSMDAMRPEQQRYQRKIEMWKKLPVWVTRVLGPAIVRGIP